ncbi:MAG: hypothetical protein ACXWCM_01395 [Acidimicrobiales bacterium]
MSDSDQRDEQDEAEALDAEMTDSLEDDYPVDFPPDQSIGVEEYGLTQAEEETGESDFLRSARELPEVDQLDRFDDLDRFEGEVDERVGGISVTDDETDGELLGEVVDDEPDASEEEAAMHIVEEP